MIDEHDVFFFRGELVILSSSSFDSTSMWSVCELEDSLWKLDNWLWGLGGSSSDLLEYRTKLNYNVDLLHLSNPLTFHKHKFRLKACTLGTRQSCRNWDNQTCAVFRTNVFEGSHDDTIDFHNRVVQRTLLDEILSSF